MAGYDAADILALDSVGGEFSVDNTPVAQAISLLLALNGGFYGWRIDPATGELVVVDMDVPGRRRTWRRASWASWQDAAGTDYRLLDNRLEWSLDGVCSTIVIQGTDTTALQRPANLDGLGNAALGYGGELELVDAPWLGWPAAYRALCQPARIADGEADRHGQRVHAARRLRWLHARPARLRRHAPPGPSASTSPPAASRRSGSWSAA